MNAGFAILARAGLSKPKIWVTPNYLASRTTYRVLSTNFAALNERAPGALYPYIINKDIHGNRIIPENLGFIQPGVVSPQMIADRADKNLVVRDGFASFFFHPQYDPELLRSAIRKVKSKGYRFADIESLI